MSVRVYPVHYGTPPLGPNIESAWFDNANDLLLFGFRSKYFVVWNETKECEVLNVECGGAHRSYAYSHLESGGGHFVYTKASRLYIYSQHKPSHMIIKPGGHGREMKTTALSPNRSLIATGAEDTTIRLWIYRDLENIISKQLECLLVVQKHTTGIQHLQWHGSNYLFSSGGNEEFFIWAVEDIPGLGIGLVCEASCPDQSEDKDLRIMSFDIIQSDPEHSEIIISLAYSDSTIRCYRYCKDIGYELVADGQYTSACLMHLRHIQISSKQLYLLTAGTDGNLVLWNTEIPDAKRNSAKLSIVSIHKLHQSTIKAFEITTFKGSIIAITGGDDNALAITAYSKNLGTLPKSVILKSAHAAAITGLCMVSISNSGELRVVSSSNDQRIKEWRVIIDGNSIVIEKIGDVFTSVADVGGLSVVRNRCDGYGEKVLVVGNGMEVFNVSSKV
jgi:WD40 repeat protein